MGKILITGAFGNVGRSTVAAHIARGDSVTLLEADTPRNRTLATALLKAWTGKKIHRLSGKGAPSADSAGERTVKLLFGDIRDPAVVAQAVTGQEVIVHLAAIIPPAADRSPELARSVNVGGTRTLIEAAIADSGSRRSPLPRFIFASSISVYGDRVLDWWIRSDDRLEPSPGDGYGRSKLEAEALLRASPLPWSILRLSYIVWSGKLDPDPLLFHMPLATKLEVCHTEDAGRAFAAAAHEEAALGKTLDIGGGESCRTTYREYLDRMLRFFGLGGGGWLPEEAFAASGFHCGWYADSDQAEELLGFRTKGLEDYYAEVKAQSWWKSLAAGLARPIIKATLLAGSPFLRGRNLRLAASQGR